MTTSRAQPEVLVTPLDSGGAVLLALETRATFTLNASGYRIWELLVQGLAPDSVAARLALEFDVEAPGALEGVARLREELSAAGLLADAPA